MSYGAAVVLQAAVYGLLSASPALAGVLVVDAVPPQGGAGTFVLIGPEEVLDQSDKSGLGAEHRIMVSVISDASGFLAAKTLAAAVSETLVDATPPLSAGRIVGIRFLKATAKRLEDGDVRRIDLTFRVRVEM
jgi:Ni,Fe-hydrogenase maturation factor